MASAQKGRTMQIYIKQLSGDVFTLDVEPEDTIETVKEQIDDEELIPPEEQRLVLFGRELEDGLSLSNQKVTDKSMLLLFPRLRGMISTFTSSDDTDPLVKMLLSPGPEHHLTQEIRRRLRDKETEEGASPSATFEYHRKNGLLKESHMDLICEFLDFLWSAYKTRGQVDMRAVIPDDCLAELLTALERRAKAHTYVRKLKRFHSQDGKIALRLTEGPTNSCISFHCDGDYATRTVQIALNDESEYRGGKTLLFL